MEPKVHCLLGASFTDFHLLPAILANSTVLNSYQHGYTSSTQTEKTKIFIVTIMSMTYHSRKSSVFFPRQMK